MKNNFKQPFTGMTPDVLRRAVLVVLFFSPLISVSVSAQIDQERAAKYFEEAEALCRREGNRLWGVSLHGPMVFADPVSKTIAANQPEPDAPRPKMLGYANTALTWGETRWSTFVWQMVPEDAQKRGRMMAHELFHRVQPDLNLFIAAIPGENEHLDTLEGRYWMQLEWRALARALGASEKERVDAIKDALAFRLARHKLMPHADEIERASEINEGLAQYTGTVVAAPTTDAAIADAIEQLGEAPEKESFVRTFAYPSGAAYGLLLDVFSPGWTRKIKVTDSLGELLMRAAETAPFEDPESAAERYGGEELWRAEKKRAEEHEARVADLRRRFVEGPVLILPRGRNASFITTGLTPLPGTGTIYPQFRVSGEWGSLEAEQVLMSLDGKTLTLPAPVSTDGASLSGHGWKVELAEGWIVRSGPRAGDYRVSRE